MFAAIVGFVVVVFIIAIWASARENNKTAKVWNDGNCSCGTGKLRFKEFVEQEDVGSFYIYTCTNCENTESFSRRLDREDIE